MGLWSTKSVDAGFAVALGLLLAVAAVATRAAEQLGFLQSSVELKRPRPGDLDAQLELMGEGRAARAETLHVLGSLEPEERAPLRERDAAAEASLRRSIVVTVSASVAATILVVLALIVVNREIRERRRAEEAVRQSETLYRTLLNHFPNGAVLLLDRDLRHRLVEGQGLAAVGLSKAGLEGKTIWEALDPDTCRAIEPAYRAALAGTATRSDVPYAGRLYEVHFNPIRDEAGEVQAGMVVTQDRAAPGRERGPAAEP
jgi:PAS domain-containing protein